MGVEVLSSANFPYASLTRDEWFDKPFPVGLFRATCTVPGNFLNEGLYSVNVLVFNRISHVEITAKEVIRFDVQDTGVMSGEWRGRWVGVVRPRLAWQTQFLREGRPVAPAGNEPQPA